MSARTIKIVDLLCTVSNWNSSIATVTAERNRLRTYGGPTPWLDEAEDEIRRWSAKRDKALTRLQTIVASLTDAELKTIRRLYQPEKLIPDLCAIGVDPGPGLREYEFG